MSVPLDPPAFAAVVLDYLNGRFPDLQFAYHEEENYIADAGGGTSITHYLENLRADYNTAAVEDRDRVLENLGNITENSLAGGYDKKPFLAVAERLLPRVIDRPYVVQTSLLGRLQVARGDAEGAPLRLATEDFLESHVMGIVVDEPESIRYVTQSDLEEWEVDFAEVRDYALRNLEIISEEPLGSAFPGVFDSPWKDNHDASRVFLPKVIGSAEVRGRRVLAMPNRDSLLIAGSEDEEGLRLLAGAIDTLSEEPRFAGGDVYIEEPAGGWSRWMPEAPDDLRSHFEMLAIQTRLMNHAGQKDMLEAVFEAEGTDVFVATLQVLQNARTAELTSWASWATGVHTYLPQADLYAVQAAGCTAAPPAKKGGFLSRLMGKGEAKEEALFVPREVVFEVASDLLRPVPDTYPPLWETLGDPDEEMAGKMALDARPL